jgi:hypothetical protein
MTSLTIHMGDEPPSGYYISPTGSDSGDGTSGSPWASLHKALSMVAAGDTVICKDGTYNGSLNRQLYFPTIGVATGTASQPIRIVAEHQHAAIFDGQANGSTDDDRYFLQTNGGYSHFVLDGLKLVNYCMVQNGVITLNGTNGTTGLCEDWSILNCDIQKVSPGDNSAQVLYFGAYFDTAEVAYNIIRGPYPATDPDGAGVGTDHTPSALNLWIHRNVFVDLHKGVQLYGDDGDPTGVTGTFEHNTFVGCGRNYDLYRHGTITVRDNAGEDASESTAYNLSDPNDSAYTTAGYNYWGETITADPEFGLTGGSSAIGGAHDGSDAGWVEYVP